MVKLFDPISIRSELIKNRAWVSPMCTYSSDEGKATDWHLVHLGSRAIGGAGLVMVEASAIAAEGRISPWDMGIWGCLLYTSPSPRDQRGSGWGAGGV